MKEESEWIEKAEEDLDTAEFNFKYGKLSAAAFYSHQAAEKALKALCILKFRRLWKTHDLVGLLTKLGSNIQEKLLERQ